MRLLLDTHVALWSVLDPTQIPGRIRQMMERNEVFVSAASIVEISIKFDNRRSRTTGMSAAEAVMEFERGGFTLLDVTAQHAAEMQSIAVGHPDPHDRLILTHAIVESLRLVTHDAALARYSDTVITW